MDGKAHHAIGGNAVYMARVTTLEVVSAIVRRSRGGSITPADAAASVAQFKLDAARDYRIIELAPATANRAQTIAETYYLRGYDAVQLASALFVRDQLLAAGAVSATVACVLISADDNLNNAARAEGLSVDNPNNHP